jgi:hypothetical protein
LESGALPQHRSSTRACGARPANTARQKSRNRPAVVARIAAGAGMQRATRPVVAPGARAALGGSGIGQALARDSDRGPQGTASAIKCPHERHATVSLRRRAAQCDAGVQAAPPAGAGRRLSPGRPARQRHRQSRSGRAAAAGQGPAPARPGRSAPREREPWRRARACHARHRRPYRESRARAAADQAACRAERVGPDPADRAAAARPVDVGIPPIRWRTWPRS